jgi:hypothetical protein
MTRFFRFRLSFMFRGCFESLIRFLGLEKRAGTAMKTNIQDPFEMNH